MKTIHKFPLAVADSQTLSMPACPEFLGVQQQGDQRDRFMLWALVDTAMPPVAVEITCYGTGHELPDNPGRYLGTVQQGSLVWHYFVRNFV